MAPSQGYDPVIELSRSPQQNVRALERKLASTRDKLRPHEAIVIVGDTPDVFTATTRTSSRRTTSLFANSNRSDATRTENENASILTNEYREIKATQDHLARRLIYWREVLGGRIEANKIGCSDWLSRVHDGGMMCEDGGSRLREVGSRNNQGDWLVDSRDRHTFSRSAGSPQQPRGPQGNVPYDETFFPVDSRSTAATCTEGTNGINSNISAFSDSPITSVPPIHNHPTPKAFLHPTSYPLSQVQPAAAIPEFNHAYISKLTPPELGYGAEPSTSTIAAQLDASPPNTPSRSKRSQPIKPPKRNTLAAANAARSKQRAAREASIAMSRMNPISETDLGMDHEMQHDETSGSVGAGLGKILKGAREIDAVMEGASEGNGLDGSRDFEMKDGSRSEDVRRERGSVFPGLLADGVIPRETFARSPIYGGRGGWGINESAEAFSISTGLSSPHYPYPHQVQPLDHRQGAQMRWSDPHRPMHLVGLDQDQMQYRLRDPRQHSAMSAQLPLSSQAAPAPYPMEQHGRTSKPSSTSQRQKAQLLSPRTEKMYQKLGGMALGSSYPVSRTAGARKNPTSDRRTASPPAQRVLSHAPQATANLGESAMVYTSAGGHIFEHASGSASSAGGGAIAAGSGVPGAKRNAGNRGQSYVEIPGGGSEDGGFDKDASEDDEVDDDHDGADESEEDDDAEEPDIGSSNPLVPNTRELVPARGDIIWLTARTLGPGRPIERRAYEVVKRLGRGATGQVLLVCRMEPVPDDHGDYFPMANEPQVALKLGVKGSLQQELLGARRTQRDLAGRQQIIRFEKDVVWDVEGLEGPVTAGHTVGGLLMELAHDMAGAIRLTISRGTSDSKLAFLTVLSKLYRWMNEVGRIVENLMFAGIWHGDLKLENFLTVLTVNPSGSHQPLEGEEKVVLADMEYSRPDEQIKRPTGGTDCMLGPDMTDRYLVEDLERVFAGQTIDWRSKNLAELRHVKSEMGSSLTTRKQSDQAWTLGLMAVRMLAIGMSRSAGELSVLYSTASVFCIGPATQEISTHLSGTLTADSWRTWYSALSNRRISMERVRLGGYRQDLNAIDGQLLPIFGKYLDLCFRRPETGLKNAMGDWLPPTTMSLAMALKDEREAITLRLKNLVRMAIDEEKARKARV